MRKQDMGNQFSKKTRKKARSIQAQRIFRSRWFKSLVAMGSVVVFCTVYSLIIPAATLTEDQATADAGIVLEEAAPSEPQPVEAPAETPASEPVQEEASKEEPVVQAVAAVEETPAEQAKEAPAAASSETVTGTPADAASTAASSEQSLNESAAAGSGSEETKTENAETANTAAANETAPAEETSGTATDETATKGTDAALTTEETTEEASTADSEESVEETTGKEEEVGTVSELKGTSGNLEAVVRFAEGAGIPENATLVIYGGGADTGKVQDALWSGSMDSIEQSTITTDLSEYVSFAVKDVDGNDITPDSDCSIEISFGSEADLSDPGENKIKKYGTLVAGSDGNVSVTGTSLSTGDGHTYATFSGKLSGNTFGFAVTTADKKVNYLEGLSGKTSDGAVEASLTFGKDAKVPEGSTLTVESASVSESSVLDKLWGNYEGVDKDTVTADDVQFVKFVIRDKDGKEISPETKVSVKLTFHHEADLSSAAEGKVKKYNALAVSSDGTITLGSKALAVENGTTTASFADVSAKTAFGYAVTTAKKKAVYATRLTGKSEDGTIEASLRLTEEAKIPEGSLLKVTPVTGETVQKTLLDNIWTDTSIIDPDTIELTDSGLAAVTITDKDGNALKPEADATLTLTFNKEADLKEAARKMVKRAKTVAMTEENVKLSDDGLSAAEGKTKVSYTGIVDGQTFGYAVSTAKQKTNFLEGKLTYEGEDYTIEVSVNKDNQIPEGSELKVKELDQDSEEFKKKLDQAAEAVQKDAEKKSSDDIEITIDDSSVRMFDITIQNEDGDEIQPNGDVSVSVQYKKAVKVSADANMKAIHFDEKNEEVKVLTPETKADTSDTEKKVHEVKFDTNGFSVYAILGTEKGTDFVDGELTFDGDGYHITLTYDADAEIPKDAKLDVKEVTGDDAKTYADKASAKLGAEVTESRFFDIHILDKDGNKIQPKKAVKIKITYDKPFEVGKDEKIQQVHFKDSENVTAGAKKNSFWNDEEDEDTTAQKTAKATEASSDDNIEVLDAKAEGNSVEFEQSSFSVTGTVVTTDNSNWPSEEGEYILVIESGNNYYAIKNDGSLTQVTYNNDKVTFPNNVNSASEYQWTYTDEENTILGYTYHEHYLNSGNNYIIPSRDSGIGETKTALTRNEDGTIYIPGWSRSNYLTVKNSRLAKTTDSNAASPVYFVKADENTNLTAKFLSNESDNHDNDITIATVEADENGEIEFPDCTDASGNEWKTRVVSGITYDFIGWSTDAHATYGEENQGKIKAAQHHRANVFKPGEKTTITDNTTYYAIWAATNQDSSFYIRLDGKSRIPTEPQPENSTDNYDANAYTKGVTITGALKEAKFYSNQAGVNDNLNSEPTATQIAWMINTNCTTRYNRNLDYPLGFKAGVNEEGELYVVGIVNNSTNVSYYNVSAGDKLDVIWYVCKHANPGPLLSETSSSNNNKCEWHVDGVLVVNNKLRLVYDANVGGKSNVLVDNTMPDGSANWEKDSLAVVGNHAGDNNTVRTPERNDGYTFLGWKRYVDLNNDHQFTDDEAVNEEPLASGTNITMEHDTKLVAQWKAPYIDVNTDKDVTHEKYIKKNEGDNYDLTLTYSGAKGESSSPEKVDVVLIVDKSSSMSWTYGNTTRIAAVKSATDILSNKLSELQTSGQADVRYNTVYFGSNRGNDVYGNQDSGWTNTLQLNTQIVSSQGTNYEAGFDKAVSALNGRRQGATTVVIFLTDGSPTYSNSHGNGTSSQSNNTIKQIVNDSVNAARNIKCDQFYTVGIGYGEDTLTTIQNAVTRSNKDSVIRCDDAPTLNNVFSNIAASVTNYYTSEVTITDKLSRYAVAQGNNSYPVVTITNSDGQNVNVNASNKQQSEYDFTYQDGDSSKNGHVSFNTSTGDIQLKLTGEINPNLTFKVTVPIKPSEEAYNEFTTSGYAKIDNPHTSTVESGVSVGETGTDAPGNSTSVGKEGFFTNIDEHNKNTGHVTYTYMGEQHTLDYPEPVIQVNATSITVKKVDSTVTSKGLTGATFKLLKVKDGGQTEVVKIKNGKVDDTGDETFTVDSTDGFRISGLIPGRYQLQEKNAPDGYIINTSNTCFKVTGGTTATIKLEEGTNNAIVDDSSKDVISIKNTAGQALPNTGGHGTMPFVLGGMFLISAAGALYIISKKRSSFVG